MERWLLRNVSQLTSYKYTSLWMSIVMFPQPPSSNPTLERLMTYNPLEKRFEWTLWCSKLIPQTVTVALSTNCMTWMDCSFTEKNSLVVPILLGGQCQTLHWKCWALGFSWEESPAGNTVYVPPSHQHERTRTGPRHLLKQNKEKWIFSPQQEFNMPNSLLNSLLPRRWTRRMERKEKRGPCRRRERGEERRIFWGDEGEQKTGTRVHFCPDVDWAICLSFVKEFSQWVSQVSLFPGIRPPFILYTPNATCLLRRIFICVSLCLKNDIRYFF